VLSFLLPACVFSLFVFVLFVSHNSLYQEAPVALGRTISTILNAMSIGDHAEHLHPSILKTEKSFNRELDRYLRVIPEEEKQRENPLPMNVYNAMTGGRGLPDLHLACKLTRSCRLSVVTDSLSLCLVSSL
jgi:hypothetical protein